MQLRAKGFFLLVLKQFGYVPSAGLELTTHPRCLQTHSHPASCIITPRAEIIGMFYHHICLTFFFHLISMHLNVKNRNQEGRLLRVGGSVAQA